MQRLNQLLIAIASQAKPLTWAMALIVVKLLIDGFFEQQGHYEFDNETIAQGLSYLSLALYTFVLFRLIKPCGVQDLQALIALLILPNPDILLITLGRDMLIAIVLVFRWTRLSRKISVVAVLLTLLMGSVICQCLNGISVAIPYSTKAGEFCSKTDGIYFLYKYKYDYGCEGKPVYGLFRIVPLLPGVKLVKRVDYLTTDKQVCVCTTPERNYIIVDGPPRDYRFHR